MRHALAISLGVGLATPAAALTPAWILCENADGSVGDFIFKHDENDQWMAGLTALTHRAVDETGDSRVLVECDTGNAMTYPLQMSRTADVAFDALIESRRKFTLRQVARRLNRVGVEARYGTIAEGHCACRPQTHRPSF